VAVALVGGHEGSRGAAVVGKQLRVLGLHESIHHIEGLVVARLPCGLQEPVSGFGFRVSGFGSGFGFRVSGFGFRV
jgi:hypothetical protein